MKRPDLRMRIEARQQTQDELRRFEQALDEFVEAFVRCHVDRLRTTPNDGSAPDPAIAHDDVKQT